LLAASDICTGRGQRQIQGLILGGVKVHEFQTWLNSVNQKKTTAIGGWGKCPFAFPLDPKLEGGIGQHCCLQDYKKKYICILFFILVLCFYIIWLPVATSWIIL